MGKVHNSILVFGGMCNDATLTHKILETNFPSDVEISLPLSHLKANSAAVEILPWPSILQHSLPNEAPSLWNKGTLPKRTFSIKGMSISWQEMREYVWDWPPRMLSQELDIMLDKGEFININHSSAVQENTPWQRPWKRVITCCQDDFPKIGEGDDAHEMPELPWKTMEGIKKLKKMFMQEWICYYRMLETHQSTVCSRRSLGHYIHKAMRNARMKGVSVLLRSPGWLSFLGQVFKGHAVVELDSRPLG